MDLASKETTVLSPEERQRFDRDGYLLIDLCPASRLDQALAELDPVYHDDSHPGVDEWTEENVVYTRYRGRLDAYRWHRVNNAWKLCAGVRAIALAPAAVAVTEELFGRRVLPFQTTNFAIGSELLPHFDSMAFQSDPPGYMCAIWVAMEDMDSDNGPLVYYPGSHKLPTPSWKEIANETGRRIDEGDFASEDELKRARAKQYRDYRKLLIDRHGLEAEYATVRKGQAVLWAANLLHGGARHRDETRTRHSQVTHYFFEGCRYHTPMVATGERIHWIYPEWIRDPPPEDTVATIQDAVGAFVEPGETVLIASSGYEGLLEMEGLRARHFPRAPDGTHLNWKEVSDDAVDHLERMRAEGARYLVFPKKQLWWLEWHLPELQDHLETRYRAVLRDGGVCVMYALD
jgi:hypothetical protein